MNRLLDRIKNLDERSQSTAFFGVIVAGLVAALALGLSEARDRPAVEFGEERVRRDGLVATVQVNARNRTDEVVCPEVRIAARDREGLDLEEVVARPQEGGPRIGPGSSQSYVGVFHNLSEDDYRERLDEFSAYVFDVEPCP